MIKMMLCFGYVAIAYLFGLGYSVFIRDLQQPYYELEFEDRMATWAAVLWPITLCILILIGVIYCMAFVTAWLIHHTITRPATALRRKIDGVNDK